MSVQHSTDHRKISQDLRPTHYALTIKTDLEKLEFEGRVEIYLDVNVNTSTITFHTAEPCLLKHASLLAPGPDDKPLTTDRFEINKELEQAAVRFGKELKAGDRVKLGLAFEGNLDWGGLAGYYKCSWEHDGKKGVYAVSMCCPTDGRKVFPCWDEPKLKATFQVSMISRTGTTSLSNMNALSTKASNGSFPTSALFPTTLSEQGAAAGEWTVTEFATTPKMSTYLLAITNGEFQYVEDVYVSTTGKDVNLRMYTTPEHIGQTKLSLDVKKRVLPIYEKLFDIPYPLPKLDTLAVSDFDSGAMENWGLIMGRAVMMVYDDKSGVAAKQRTTKIETHEIAHQWFGNIVTMKWWDNLWLNEAFATLTGELVTIQEMHPEWRPNAAFVDSHLNRALQLDSLRSSHPIEVPCPDEKTAGQILDAISYSKGASVLRMLSSMVGQDTFMKGVSLYLKAHLYCNSVTRDLWDGISRASGANIQELMENWTLKVGFPLVTVTESDSGLHIRQNRFLATNDVRPEEDETLWRIPLNLKTLGPNGRATVDRNATLTTRDKIFPVRNIAESLYKVNTDTAGVYRVLYTPAHLAKLADAASRPGSIFSAEDRMGLIDDAFTLARSGHGSTSAALELVSKLRHDGDNFVWGRIARGLAELTSAWWEQPGNVQKGLRAFRRSLFGPLARNLGFDFQSTDSPDLTQWRVTAISEAAAADDPRTLSDMKSRFSRLMQHNDGSQIAGDIQRAIYANMVRIGGDAEWSKVHQIYRGNETLMRKQDAMLALCFAQSPSLISATFDLVKKGEIKPQDYAFLFSALSRNPATRRQAWRYLQDNFDALTSEVKGGFVMRGMMAQAITELSSLEDLHDVEAFFEHRDTSAYDQALAHGLDEIRSKARWLERDHAPVEKWLFENGYINDGSI